MDNRINPEHGQSQTMPRRVNNSGPTWGLCGEDEHGIWTRSSDNDDDNVDDDKGDTMAKVPFPDTVISTPDDLFISIYYYTDDKYLWADIRKKHNNGVKTEE